MTGDVARTTARVVERSLARVTGVLDNVRLRLRAVDVSRDPDTKRWAEDMKARVASGEIEQRLAQQPDDPRVLVERVRRSSPA